MFSRLYEYYVARAQLIDPVLHGEVGVAAYEIKYLEKIVIVLFVVGSRLRPLVELVREIQGVCDVTEHFHFPFESRKRLSYAYNNTSE